jgi:serine/threonine protein kinase
VLDISGASTVRATAAVTSTTDSVARSVEAFRAATAIAGTPVYMAPEVLRGESATAASDQFGFGVTLHELLAGKRPFTGQSLAEISRAIERDPIPSLRGVPSWLEAATRRCLALDAAQRFASLAAVAAYLEERLQRRRPVAVFAGPRSHPP